MQVLPQLVGVIPEAKLNLLIYFLKNDEIDEAYELIKDMEPLTSQECMLKAVALCCYAQRHDALDQRKQAHQLFHLVGSSASECDTIPGRQSMASFFFLLGQWEEVLIYLSSIRNYFPNDDDFNWNFGIAKAQYGEYKEAEEALLLIQNEYYKNDYCYISWLARCYINNGKPSQAWDLHLKMENSNEGVELLHLIANDCYKIGEFYYSAKAFDALERYDSGAEEIWCGKRGACVGVFQQVIAGEMGPDALREVFYMLQTSGNAQAENIQAVMKNWARENNVQLVQEQPFNNP
ncbi:intraflagellar transport protein 56 [Pelomyxa schiedti]|nr:intraflagellar transport protein 56 [Pelomyxa schiedti]